MVPLQDHQAPPCRCPRTDGAHRFGGVAAAVLLDTGGRPARGGVPIFENCPRSPAPYKRALGAVRGAASSRANTKAAEITAFIGTPPQLSPGPTAKTRKDQR